MIKQLQEEARKLLKDKKVDLIIGYELCPDRTSTSPCFLEKEEEVERLVWNEHCLHNLSRYLIEAKRFPLPEGEKPTHKIGIVAKGCDVKSIIGLIQENQIKREEVVIIGMECAKQMADDQAGGIEKEEGMLAKCKSCDVHIPKSYDVLINNPRAAGPEPSARSDPYSQLGELEDKSAEERWGYWSREFKKCIKCYACRQICPLCFCPECITDQTHPLWIAPSASLPGNVAWNVVRAYHLAGRCIDCGECERACPMKIPLRKINRKLEKEVKQLFDYQAGEDPEAKPPLADFRLDDDEDFIK